MQTREPVDMLPSAKLVTAKLVDSIRRKGFLGTLKSCAAEVEEIRFDRKFGIQTLETMSDRQHVLTVTNQPGDNLGYQPTKIRTLRKILGDLRIAYEDFIFLDLGSGKGRTLLIASEFPFKRIIGVEVSPELHCIAETNIRAYRSATQECRAIESHCDDAVAYELPAENTLIFLFNPFKAPLISKLLLNLSESLRQNPRRIYLVYYNPVCHDLIADSEMMEVVRVTDLYTIYRNKDAGSDRAPSWS